MNTPRTRVQRRPVHGVLLLDKPLGLSSNQALQKAKWLLRAEKAGHTGTLDPLATGVLLLCFGAATKFSQLHLDADKAYSATLQLGIKTSTADAEGDVIETRPVDVTREQLQAVAKQFTGRLSQTPPMHSALKRDGRPLYELAREGIEVERESRDIEIYELNIAEPPAGAAFSAINIEVRCSKGTYIRTLAEDIGEMLGCGGHLTALRRTVAGGFDVARCITLAQLEAMDDDARFGALLPIESLVAGHRPITLTADDAGRFLSGLRRRGDWADESQVAVFDLSKNFLGTAHIKARELIPGRLLNPIESQQIHSSTAPVCETIS